MKGAPAVLRNRRLFGLVLYAALFPVPRPCAAARADTWEAIVRLVPINVSVKDKFDGVDAYIIRQTHEPYFRLDDGENYTSRIIGKWSRELDYTGYLFCPKPGLEFDKAAPFSPAVFYTKLTETTSRYRAAFTAERDGDCVRVSFKEPARGYLAFLTRYENAPTMSAAPDIEAGLGPFYVEKLSGEEAVLKRKKPVRGGYNRIVIRKWSGPEDPVLNDRSVSDFNLLPTPPKWLAAEFREFSNLDPRAIVLVINHRDPKLRKALYRCLDVEKFRDAFVKFRDYQNIRTILPLGVSGASAGLPAAVCGPGDRFPGESLVLISQKPDNKATLEAFAEEFRGRTGIKIRVRNEAPQDITTMLKKTAGARPYNLIVFVLDSSRNEYEDYFRYFVPGKDLSVDWGTEGLAELYGAMTREDSPEKKTALAKRLAQEISDRALALPLFQYSRKVYYPKHIKNFSVGRGFIEYPEVADFRW